MNEWHNSLTTQYTGFQSCIQAVKHANTLRARRIYIKDKQKDADVILEPREYLRQIESIRAQIKR